MFTYVVTFALPSLLVVLLPRRWAARAVAGVGFVLASALAFSALVFEVEPDWEGGPLGLVALAGLLFAFWMAGVLLGVVVRATVRRFRA
jgi:hypothetical protein